MPRSSVHRWHMVVMVALWAAACGSEDGKSPLATWDPSPFEAFISAPSGTGTLEITADCVRLIRSNQQTVLTVLLVWPEPTSWNASAQVIEFVDIGGNRFELRAGDRISLAGLPLREGFDPRFVVPPDPSCEADETFIVHRLGPVTG